MAAQTASLSAGELPRLSRGCALWIDQPHLEVDLQELGYSLSVRKDLVVITCPILPAAAACPAHLVEDSDVQELCLCRDCAVETLTP